MIRTTRRSLTTKIAVCVVSLACASLSLATVAAGAAVASTYHKESFGEYKQQLAGGQIQAVKINRKLRRLLVTLNNGHDVRAAYGLHEKRKILTALRAKHVPVTLLTAEEANAEIASKPVHHKLRYVAGAILIVVIAGAALLFYLYRRRRARALE